METELARGNGLTFTTQAVSKTTEVTPTTFKPKNFTINTTTTTKKPTKEERIKHFFDRMTVNLHQVVTPATVSEEFKANAPIGCIHKGDEFHIEPYFLPAQFYIPPRFEPIVVTESSEDVETTPIPVTTTTSTAEPESECGSQRSCVFEHFCHANKSVNFHSGSRATKNVSVSFIVSSLFCRPAVIFRVHFLSNTIVLSSPIICMRVCSVVK